jgi:Amt family ammonium transporter
VKIRLSASFVFLLSVFLSASTAFAQDPAAAPAGPALNSGDTAFVLISAALVLLMTIPGLALFYGGMVRTRTFSER